MSLLLLVWILGAAYAAAHPSAEHRIEWLTNAIKDSPEDQRLHIQRGQAYSNEGMLDRALTDLRKAETLGDPVLAAYDLGVVLYQQGKFDEARNALDRFLARFPRHSSALGYRARVLRDAGHTKEALADYRAYFEIQKAPNPGDYIAAADLFVQSDDAGIDEALAILDEGIARLGLNPQLQQRAIALERGRAHYDAAIERHRSLEPMLGKSPEWKVEMGALLFAVGRITEAERQFDLASKQLDALRETKSRRALRKRLDGLRSRKSQNLSASE